MEKELLFDLFEEFEYPLDDEEIGKLLSFYELLIEWNTRVNLTTVTDFEDVLKRHFLDSASLFFIFNECDEYYIFDIPDDITEEELEALPTENDRFENIVFSDEVSLLDIGTGAGFPGIVISILRPDWSVTLLESQQKRVDFLEKVVAELSLDNVHVIRGRAEEFGHDISFRQQFDLVVSRAVAKTNILLELCMPFVKPDGFFVSYKGPSHEEEVEAAKHAEEELNCRLCLVRKYLLYDMERYLLLYIPTGDLPDKYPRRDGIPAKRPL